MKDKIKNLLFKKEVGKIKQIRRSGGFGWSSDAGIIEYHGHKIFKNAFQQMVYSILFEWGYVQRLRKLGLSLKDQYRIAKEGFIQFKKPVQ